MKNQFCLIKFVMPSNQSAQEILDFMDYQKYTNQMYPFRPILDMSTSPYHSVAKWLSKLLESIRQKTSPYSIKDTFHCLEAIKEINIRDKLLFSLDVQSLFTNIPLLETVDYLCDFIQNQNINVGIPVMQLKELILRCTMNVQFQFNNKYYRQIDGVAMGSPLGPLLADVFMAKLENGPLKSTINNLQIYKRYVDDIFVICDTNANIQDILYTFNSCHPSAQFTCEMERNNELPFLDILIRRNNDGSIQRKVYRKPTWTGQYLHYLSSVPLKYKRNLIQCLANRAMRICTPDTISDELEYIEEILLTNGYPKQFIKANMKTKNVRPLNYNVPKKLVYLNLPFRDDVSHDIVQRQLDRQIEKSFPAARLRIINSTQRLIPPQGKDILPHHSASKCVYQFTCTCGVRYIGRTMRLLSKRMSEHNPVSLRSGMPKSISSSIVEHLVDSNHVISPKEAFSVLFSVPQNLNKGLSFRLLSTAEAIAIRHFNPELCKQKHLLRALQLPWP